MRGATGFSGQKGDIGATGSVGQKGESGAHGSRGEKGDRGEGFVSKFTYTVYLFICKNEWFYSLMERLRIDGI